MFLTLKKKENFDREWSFSKYGKFRKESSI
jgi:hypothetical protein